MNFSVVITSLHSLQFSVKVSILKLSLCEFNNEVTNKSNEVKWDIQVNVKGIGINNIGIARARMW